MKWRKLFQPLTLGFDKIVTELIFRTVNGRGGRYFFCPNFRLGIGYIDMGQPIYIYCIVTINSAAFPERRGDDSIPVAKNKN